MECKTRLTVYGVINNHTIPALYSGVIELPDRGYTNVVVAVPYGVRIFPKVPIVVMVNNKNTIVHYSGGKKPTITVNEWYFETMKGE